jgi:hypothetical protein
MLVERANATKKPEVFQRARGDEKPSTPERTTHPAEEE